MDRLEFRHVRAFLSVAQHLHFARAAEALDMAPPALTRQGGIPEDLPKAG